jgi:PAS domain-containing protein
MSDLIAVSDLIGDIYDAALDPSLWPLVLERIVRYFEAAAAVLYVQDLHLREGQFYFSYGDDPHFTRLYLEKYARINPLAPHFMVTNVGDVFRAGQLIPYEELKKSQFYKEWLEPQRYTEFVATTLDKSATGAAFVSVTRDKEQGFMDDASVERMRLIAPHLRRAIMIGKIIDLKKVEAANFESVINGLLDAVMLVDAPRRIVYANESATRMMSEAEIIRRGTADTLQVNDADAHAILRDALTVSERVEAALEVRGTAISLRSTDGERYLAHVLPLTSGARRWSGEVAAPRPRYSFARRRWTCRRPSKLWRNSIG